MSSAKRGDTALRRYRCSKPLALALAQGVLRNGLTFFDYGCGHGTDITYLLKRGFPADGWDPVHRPAGRVAAADVLNLGYVLNVIEDITERSRVLETAFRLAVKTLIVSVRVDHSANGDEFNDGVITRKGTFQKLFTQQELVEYISTQLGIRPHVIAPGILYVFKNAEEELRFLASRAFTRRLEYRTDLIEEFSKNPVAQRFVRLAGRLGRTPLREEFDRYEDLVEAFGSPERIERLTLRQVDTAQFNGSREQRREDILTYLATMRLQGLRPPPFQSLPATVQEDVRVLWHSYRRAIEQGDQFLFSLGRPDSIRAACTVAPVGKLLPEDLYVHRSCEDELPALLRVLLFAARTVVGEVPFEVLKISFHGRSVSFLSYPDFDDTPHPSLARSVRVFLPRATFSIREYAGSENPPILHRKDALVAITYPRYKLFRQLSDEEDALGLLSSPNIGTREGWTAILASKGLRLEGHHLALVSRDPAV